MAKKVFFPGSVVTADDCNGWSNPQFDGLDENGHHPQIIDAYLDPAGILSRVSTVTDSFKASIGAGISVNIAAGSIKLLDSSILTKSAGNLVLPSSGTYFIYLDKDGNYAYATTLPVVNYAIAKVTLSAGAITTLTDLRVRSIGYKATTSRVFGGQGGEKSLLIKGSGVAGWDVTNTIYTAIGTVGTPYALNGERWFNDLTIESTAFVSVVGGTKVYCTGNVTIAGTVDVSAPIRGGGLFSGTIHQMQVLLSNAGLGAGAGSGHNAAASPIYNYFLQPCGSGGASSFTKGLRLGTPALSDISDTLNITTGAGGNGGGLFLVEAGGSINVSGTIRCNGGNATNAVYISGKTAFQGLIITGASGGSGGLIWLASALSITVTPAASLECKGGNGGIGYISTEVNATYKANGGGGGGGGYVVLTAPTIVTSGVSIGSQIRLDGGTKGAAAGSGANIAAGSIGASFGGLGGISDANGNVGQWIVNNLTPV